MKPFDLVPPDGWNITHFRGHLLFTKEGDSDYGTPGAFDYKEGAHGGVAVSRSDRAAGTLSDFVHATFRSRLNGLVPEQGEDLVGGHWSILVEWTDGLMWIHSWFFFSEEAVIELQHSFDSAECTGPCQEEAGRAIGFVAAQFPAG